MSEYHTIFSLIHRCKSEKECIEKWDRYMSPVVEHEKVNEIGDREGYLFGKYASVSWHSKENMYCIEVEIVDYDEHGFYVDEELIKHWKEKVSKATGLEFEVLVYRWYDGTDRP